MVRDKETECEEKCARQMAAVLREGEGKRAERKGLVEQGSCMAGQQGDTR